MGNPSFRRRGPGRTRPSFPRWGGPGRDRDVHPAFRAAVVEVRLGSATARVTVGSTLTRVALPVPPERPSRGGAARGLEHHGRTQRRRRAWTRGGGYCASGTCLPLPSLASRSKVEPTRHNARPGALVTGRRCVAKFAEGGAHEASIGLGRGRGPGTVEAVILGSVAARWAVPPCSGLPWESDLSTALARAGNETGW